MKVLPTAQTVAERSATATLGPIDTHAHIFERHVPMVPERRYTPAYDAPLNQYLQMLDEHGIAKGVLVQPSFLGNDNSYLVGGLRRAAGRLRGVVVVHPSAEIATLEALDAVGVVGIRLNLIGRDIPSFGTEPWINLFNNIASLNWLIEVQRPASDLELLLPALLQVGVPVVVDHFGLFDGDSGCWSIPLRALEAGGKSRRLWLKLSAPYRLGGNGAGEEIGRRIYPNLRDAVGLDRLVWGSDWPHTQFEGTESYIQACNSVRKIVPNQAERRQILHSNALSLFRFANRTPLGESGET